MRNSAISVTLRPPPQKSRGRFPFNESRSGSFLPFLLRLRLRRDEQILALCSFRVALCLASALLTQEFSCLSEWISGLLLHVFIFLSWQHTPGEEKGLQKHLSLRHQARMTKAPVEQLEET